MHQPPDLTLPLSSVHMPTSWPLTVPFLVYCAQLRQNISSDLRSDLGAFLASSVYFSALGIGSVVLTSVSAGPAAKSDRPRPSQTASGASSRARKNERRSEE